MTIRTLTTYFAATAWAWSALAQAADYPSKPITMIVPLSAGGPTDTVARLLCQSMGADL